MVKIKKEWVKRAIRTFWQAFIGVIITEAAAGINLTDKKGIITIVIGPAIAAGLAAIMNMDNKKESGGE